MFNNAIIDFFLRHIPRDQWNGFSSLCTRFSRPTIGSPIRFPFNDLLLVEFPADNFPAPFNSKFLSFCYPSSIPDREEQIENDRKYYWKNASTFLVLNSTSDILGCVQVIFRNDAQFLPVEYADITTAHGVRKPFTVAPYLRKSRGPITEIYRCRRSFNLSKTQTFNVLMMLFKAIYVKISQINSSYSLISFDSAHSELGNLYVKKCDFTNPHITLTYGRDPKKWSLLVKDWEVHKTQYVPKGVFQFYMQTWNNLHVRKNPIKPKHKYNHHTVATESDILFTQTVNAKKKKSLIKTEQQRSLKKFLLRKEKKRIIEGDQIV